MSCYDKIINILDTYGWSNQSHYLGTDKNSVHSYCEVYGKYLNDLLDKSGNMLEIGTKTGGSAVLWNKLLPNFNICLLDKQNILEQDNKNRLDLSKINYITHVRGAYEEPTRDEIKNLYPEKFDFITEDGSHELEDQIRSIDLYLPLLKPGGIMVIEDIQQIEDVEVLLKTIPAGHTYEYFDLRHVKSRYDDIILVIKKDNVKTNLVNKKTKIVMISMFKNESTTIGRMLESCYQYIDYYVLQNNGSTDGTELVVENFFKDKDIPGFVYNVEEGWVGFGWNRDHLLQTCQKTDHDCDWILKMDCDEVLEVDDDFDWSLLDDTTIQSFHIPAVSGTCIYHRAWMWNAKLPWSFNHDTCHETIRCDIDGVGEQFTRFDLPKSFRQVGYNEGQSWTVPTKFISDALILEEKMIKEKTMLSDMYHFWYIGKSYMDAFPSDALYLGESHNKEYARRCLYYFQEYLNHCDNYKNPSFIDETIYITLIFMAEIYTYLGQQEEAIDYYKQSEKFAPGRNDHLFGLSYAYERKGDYEQMLNCTTIMMQPERVNPFPNYVNFINTSMYHDEGDRVQNIHELAKRKYKEQKLTNKPLPFYINKSQSKKLFVVDNFYSNPDEVRDYALNVEYIEDLRWYKGLRSSVPYRPNGIKEVFESIIGEKITAFTEHCYNGCFQICKSEDRQVYHYDLQKWAAMIYLTPDAPLVSGTRLHKSKINGARHILDANVDESFNGNFYDSTKFDIVDSVGNIYNRLVIMDAQSIHSAGPYFGSNKTDSRLTHLFFFD
jgi:glycosyltransferase involved in cell wall biosynthesis/predicted O-methyltransferase YrrM